MFNTRGAKQEFTKYIFLKFDKIGHTVLMKFDSWALKNTNSQQIWAIQILNFKSRLKFQMKKQPRKRIKIVNKWLQVAIVVC